MGKRSRLPLGLVLVLLTPFAVPPLWGTEAFRAMGPPQGCLDSLTVDGGGRWYVATSGSGLAVSGDRGEAWSSPALDDDPPRALAVGHPGELFAAGTRALYRSVDGGRTWERRASLTWDPEEVLQQDLLVRSAGSPQAAGTLYLARGKRLLVSRDGGRVFVEVLAAPNPILALVVDPRRPARVFVGLAASALSDPVVADTFYASGDAGSTWRRAAIAGPQFSAAIDQLAYQPASGTLFAIASLGLFRSDDLGRSWRGVVPRRGQFIPEEGYAYRVFFDSRDVRTVYVVHQKDSSVDLLVSRDLGASWRVVGRGSQIVFAQDFTWIGTRRLLARWAGQLLELDLGTGALRLLPIAADRGSYACAADRTAKVRFLTGDSSTVFVTAGGGLWTSRDGGASWRRNPERGFQFFDVAGEPGAGEPREIFAATDQGLRLSVNGGRTFHAVGPNTSTLRNVLWLSDFVLAGSGGVFVSSDGGESETLTLPDLPPGGREGDDDRTLTVLQADPWLSGRVLATVVDGFGRHSRYYEYPLFQSFNHGQDWRKLPFEGFAVALDRHAGGRLGSRLFLWSTDALRRSDDQGASWETVRALGPDDCPARDLVADPRVGGYLWLACDDGVRRSVDGGLSFSDPLPGTAGKRVSRLFPQEALRGRIWAVTDRGLLVGRFALAAP